MNSSQLIEVMRGRELAREGQARRLRQQAELSLSEVGLAVGVSASTVCKWERARRRPTGAAALRYARLLESIVGNLPASPSGTKL